nr:transketolase family protein [Lachnospiraceae bacterium]
MSEVVKKATRDGFGEAITELGLADRNIVVIDMDLGKSCKTGQFMKACPDQYFDVGIAEQNGAGLAAGLASCGKIPYVVTYAAFSSMRMLEMIRQEVCYTNLNVRIIGAHGGFTPAYDGASHQAIEDMGILRTIPNMTVVMPSDYVSAKKLVTASAYYEGPLYLRLTRDAIPVLYGEDEEFVIGKAHLVREGGDAAILANGDTVRKAVEAADLLAADGIRTRVLDVHTIKPLDAEAVTKALTEIGKVVTVEDHNIIGGLGSAVCEVAAELGCGKVRRIGVQDRFGESAPYERLLEKNGITAENIARTAKELIGR